VWVRDQGRTGGLLLGAVGVLLFSFTFPATKWALEGFSPWFIAFGRAVLAAVLACGALALRRAPRPTRRQVGRLAVVAGGVVVGFPLLSSLALQTAGSAHGAIVIALLPAATVVAAVALAGERPGPLFWLATLAGVAIVTAFAVSESSGSLSGADLYLLAAVAVCGVGYAQGGALSRELGAIETICWALVLSLPLTLVVAALSLPASAPPGKALAGFLYSGIASMFLGFFAWYAGLARGGVARVGQLQLFQPLLTVGWSALVLGEQIGWPVLVCGLGAIASVAVSQRARVGSAGAQEPLPIHSSPPS
jgi:drug/metabolite transporter (DMT)-like permease